jgi:MFS family permease
MDRVSLANMSLASIGSIDDDRESRIIVWSDTVVAATTTTVRGATPWRVMVISMVATLTSMSFGYDVGVISGSLDDMATTLHLTTIEREVVTSGLSFVAAVGAVVVSGGLMDWVGRKVRLHPPPIIHPPPHACECGCGCASAALVLASDAGVL